MAIEQPDIAFADIALQDIRAAEAARVIGMLDVRDLPSRAERWMEAGIETSSIRALVDSEPLSRAILLSDVASELGLTFGSTQEARAVHARTVIDAMAESETPGVIAYHFSNNYTDDLSSRVRGAISRFFRRR